MVLLIVVKITGRRMTTITIRITFLSDDNNTD